MAQFCKRPARVMPRANRPSTAYSKTIARAVAPETRSQAAVAAGALLTSLHPAAAAGATAEER
ncbi:MULTISPECIES: hypothetical protein [unclassified Streptomyces]|uniref:hypothetical protein n=1 Tax=unclassified Streptomyces TaxID=2593676 RepID=UPI00081EBF46|nr:MULTISPECIES: hypothetical protein [unclassified Streptomyces]MYZ37352.1 hypothetical protein [Streptomyces sp. SID4917]SCF90695.1 hypothetical protein GA0115259_104632 [Streptomyces sp. MnatMP-M17]